MATAQQPQSVITQWRVDPAHTTVEFAVKHMMIATVRGRFSEVDGTVHQDASNPAATRVEVSIKAASIDTRVPDRDAHLRSADFLDVEKYPEITFRSTRVERAGGEHLRIEGDLTLHGVTRPIVLDVTEEGRGKDPWGGDRAGYSATTTIDRRDYGLLWNQALEQSGGWLVGHEVKITMDVELVRQD
jgi:polyisoprenoid-binding protein YceI